MEYILILLIGVIIGSIATKLYLSKLKADGRIVINKSDPEFATAGIEFYKGANDISEMKRVTLEIYSQQ